MAQLSLTMFTLDSPRDLVPVAILLSIKKLPRICILHHTNKQLCPSLFCFFIQDILYHDGESVVTGRGGPVEQEAGCSHCIHTQEAERE